MPAGRRGGRAGGGGGSGGSVTTHEAASNPHPAYATDTDLSTHEADTTSIHGITDTSALATSSSVTSAVSTHAGLADPHTGYVLESLYDAKGDVIAASADNTPAKLTAGANDTVLTADSAQATGLKWASTGVAAHEADTTAIHGITDTAQVAIRNAANTFTADVSAASSGGLLLTHNSGRVWFGSVSDASLSRVGASIIGVSSLFDFPEVADPAAPAANRVRLYCRDNGSGKTQLMALFNSGAAQVIATEP